VANADIVTLRRAARHLVGLGLLASESERRHIDVIVDGCGYRYLNQFWTLTGVLEASDGGWHLRFDGNGGAARVRHCIAREWVKAGAPGEWARAEADSALEAFLGHTVGMAWGTA
jgi:hypothetical protein